VSPKVGFLMFARNRLSWLFHGPQCGCYSCLRFILSCPPMDTSPTPAQRDAGVAADTNQKNRLRAIRHAIHGLEAAGHTVTIHYPVVIGEPVSSAVSRRSCHVAPRQHFRAFVRTLRLTDFSEHVLLLPPPPPGWLALFADHFAGPSGNWGAQPPVVDAGTVASVPRAPPAVRPGEPPGVPPDIWLPGAAWLPYCSSLACQPPSCFFPL
jgi:hypothetical protein